MFKEKRYKQVYILVLLLLFTLGMNFLLPNYGGSGWQMPQNVMVSLFVAILIAISTLKIIHSGSIILSRMQFALFLLILCIVLPGLINYESETQALIPRLIPLLGVLLLFQSLQQFQLSERTITTILYIICISGLIQIVYGLSQKYLNLLPLEPFVAPRMAYGQPIGIFQQYNMIATYLSTVALISFYLLSKAKFVRSFRAIVNVLFLLTIIFGVLYILSLSSSRAGLLGFVIGSTLLLIFLWRDIPAKKYVVTLFIMLLAMVYFVKGGNIAPSIDRTIKATSSLSMSPLTSQVDKRIPIWIVASNVYLNSPWIGHGLGNFEKVYKQEQNVYYDSGVLDVNKTLRPVSHPHNEALFLAVESGAIALSAFVMFIFYYIFTLFSIGVRHAVLWLAFLFPIGFQVLVSFPFYLSTIHLVVFILLMGLSVSKRSAHYKFTISVPLKLGLGTILLSFLMVYTFFVWSTLNSLLDIGLYKFTKYQHEQLLDQPLKSIIWNKEATILAKNKVFYSDMKRQNAKGIRDYIIWLKEQIHHNEKAKLYIHLAQAHLSLGELVAVKEILGIIKARYPLEAQKESVKGIEAFALKIKQQFR
jgi:O-antigen polymerase